jgi:hypothetical protein
MKRNSSGLGAFATAPKKKKKNNNKQNQQQILFYRDN